MDKIEAKAQFEKILLELPASINVDKMSDEKIHEKLQRGYEDAESERTQNAEEVFQRFREKNLQRKVD